MLKKAVITWKLSPWDRHFFSIEIETKLFRLNSNCLFPTKTITSWHQFFSLPPPHFNEMTINRFDFLRNNNFQSYRKFKNLNTHTQNYVFYDYEIKWQIVMNFPVFFFSSFQLVNHCHMTIKYATSKFNFDCNLWSKKLLNQKVIWNNFCHSIKWETKYIALNLCDQNQKKKNAIYWNET